MSKFPLNVPLIVSWILIGSGWIVDTDAYYKPTKADMIWQYYIHYFTPTELFWTPEDGSDEVNEKFLTLGIGEVLETKLYIKAKSSSLPDSTAFSVFFNADEG